MFLKNTAGQWIGFEMIDRLTGRKRSDVTPSVKVAKDGGANATGGGTVVNAGDGKFWYGPTQAETNCEALSVVMLDTDCFPMEKTAFPFDPGAVPISSGAPGVVQIAAVGGFFNNPGFGTAGQFLVSAGAGLPPVWDAAETHIRNADATHTGLVSTGPQTFGGVKAADGFVVQGSGLGLTFGILLRTTDVSGVGDAFASPEMVYRSTVWDAGAVASVLTTWTTQSEPVTGSPAVGHLTFRHFFGSGASAVVADLDSNGVFTAARFIGDGSGLTGLPTGGPWMAPFVDPTAQAWGWFNQGGASVTVNGQVIDLQAGSAAGRHLRIREIAIPASPYTVTMAADWNGFMGSQAIKGLCLRDSITGKLKLLGYDTFYPGLIVYNFTDENTYNSSLIGATQFFFPKWWRVQNDGVHLTFFFSNDGWVWTQLYQEAVNAFVAPDKIGFFADTDSGAGDTGLTVLSWEMV